MSPGRLTEAVIITSGRKHSDHKNRGKVCLSWCPKIAKFTSNVHYTVGGKWWVLRNIQPKFNLKVIYRSLSTTRSSPGECFHSYDATGHSHTPSKANRAWKDIDHRHANTTIVLFMKSRRKVVRFHNARSVGLFVIRRGCTQNASATCQKELKPLYKLPLLRRNVRASKLQMCLLLPDTALVAGRFVPVTPSLPNGISDALVGYDSGSNASHSKQRGMWQIVLM